jgi:hypothetical protein
MSARALGFAGLLLGSPAFGSAPVEVPSSPEAAPAAPQLAPRWSVEVDGDRVLVSLHVRNLDDAAVDVLVARGTLPGANVSARVGVDTYLEPVLSRQERVQTFSRMGPMPRYAVAGAGEELLVGTWEFARTKEQHAEPITLEASVWAGADRVTFEWTGSGDGSPVVAASS